MNNPSARAAVAKEFETLEADKSVKSFEILDKNDNELVTINQEEFYAISDVEEFNEKNENIKVENDAKLNIISLDLELKKKWDFFFNGNRISAKIKDSAFAEAIEKGERFGMGDSLTVEMDIKQEYDPSVDTFVNKSYIVTKILDHTIRPKQIKMDFE